MTQLRALHPGTLMKVSTRTCNIGRFQLVQVRRQSESAVCPYRETMNRAIGVRSTMYATPGSIYSYTYTYTYIQFYCINYKEYLTLSSEGRGE